jgi:hypothetical protein
VKALSVQQPWASLIASGEKTIETRTWGTEHRGDLLICAAKRSKPGAIIPPDLPTGVALCIVTVADCRPMTADDAKAACCELYPRAVSWVLTNVRPVQPFAVRGQQRLFEVDLDRLKQSARTQPPLPFEPAR